MPCLRLHPRRGAARARRAGRRRLARSLRGGRRRRRPRGRLHRPRRDPRARARRLRALRACADRARRRRARRPARSAGPAARRREGLRPDRGARRGHDGDQGRAGERRGARQGRAARGAPAARQRRPDAVVPRLQEPPRRADAVALRDDQGRRTARLAAPLSDRQAGPDAGRPRGRPPLSRASTGRPQRATSPSGPGSPSRMHSGCGTRSADDLAEVRVGKRSGWLLRDDVDALESPPPASGVRLLPPGDPYLQKSNRPLLAPDAGLRKQLFRPVASPGAVLRDGRLAGLWRAKAKGRKAEITVEPLGRPPPARRPRGGGAARRGRSAALPKRRSSSPDRSPGA